MRAFIEGPWGLHVLLTLLFQSFSLTYLYNRMNPNNRELMQYLNGISSASKPQYERTVKRYNYFCGLEQIVPSAINVFKTINFTRISVYRH